MFFFSFCPFSLHRPSYPSPGPSYAGLRPAEREEALGAGYGAAGKAGSRVLFQVVRWVEGERGRKRGQIRSPSPGSGGCRSYLATRDRLEAARTDRPVCGAARRRGSPRQLLWPVRTAAYFVSASGAPRSTRGTPQVCRARRRASLAGNALGPAVRPERPESRWSRRAPRTPLRGGASPVRVRSSRRADRRGFGRGRCPHRFR